MFVVTVNRGVAESRAVALASLLAFILLTSLILAASEPQQIVDSQGRTLNVIILAVNEDLVDVRRQDDGREFSIPINSLSEESQKLVQNFAISAAAKPGPAIGDEVLARFKRKWQAIKARIPVADAPANPKARVPSLSEFLVLEKELIIAGSPKDPASSISWPDTVDQRTAQKVEELRQAIRDGERQLIHHQLAIKGEEKPDRLKIWQNKQKLRTLYNTKIGRLKQDEKKALWSIAREKSSARKDEGKIEELTKHAETAKAAIALLNQAFYSDSSGRWWEHDPAWPADHPAEILRKEISAAREKYHQQLIKKADHSGEADYHLAEIDGVSVYSSNLGVILDISGSMSPHIKKLKEQIDKEFANPVYKEVVGCSLNAVITPQGVRAYGGVGDDTMSRIEEMLLIYKVDTIYWFCDLNDKRGEEAIYYLGDLLRMSGAKFYVRSVGKRPDKDLKDLISDF